MRVYRTLAKVFPRSFTAKVFFLAFRGTHVPLIALVAYVLGTSEDLAGHFGAVVVVLVATLIGTGATLLALKAVLRPIYRIERTMQEFEATGTIEPLPLDMNDELGRLMQRTVRMMNKLTVRIETSERSADTDPLTGLLNRRGFDRRVAASEPGAVLLFDLDHFKAVNDEHGHDAGDNVLQAVALIMAGAIRHQDTLARYGGEEFVIFLPGVTRSEAALVAERIRGDIEAGLAGRSARVTTSVGVSVGSTCVSSLLAQADQAAYAAKRLGRNRVLVFEEPAAE
jgi:diguanylate cyclase (GGDEF)-like protein